MEKIAATAPLFLETLQYIAKQARTDNPERKNDYSSRFVMLLAILCFTQRQTRSSNLPTNLGLHFLARGSKVQEIDLLAHFGISASYKTVQRALKSQRDCEAIKVASMGSSEWAVTTYDNFEQVEGVKSQRLDNNSTFFSVTTGEVLQGVDIPPGGLRQDMFDKTVQLGINDVLFTPGNKNDELENDVSESNLKVTNISTIEAKLQSLLIDQLQISRYFITEAISHTFPDAVNEVFASAQGHRPSMPSIDILPCRKTDHRPLGSIPHDESNNTGTLAVLENIFRGQYRLQKDTFTNMLLLIYSVTGKLFGTAPEPQSSVDP